MVTGVLTTSYPRWSGDYAGSFVADRVAALVRAGERVEVIAAADSIEVMPSPREAQRSGGRYGGGREHSPLVPIHRIPFSLPGSRPLFYSDGAPEMLEGRHPGVWLQAARFWAGLCAEAHRRRGSWSRIETHWLVPCGLAGALAGLPHRAFAHSGDVALLERLPAGRTLARYLADSGADISFVSDDLRRRFSRLAGRACGAVRRLEPDPALFSPVDPAERARLCAAHGVTGPTLVATGRLVPIKGFDLLIDAAAHLRSREPIGPQPLVAILGDGPERTALERRARSANVELHMPGSIPRHEVAEWLRLADVYVQPSRPLPGGRTEGLPYAALEAVSVGVPVVASASGGLVDLADLGPKVQLVPAEDHVALAEAVRNQLRGDAGYIA